MGNVIPMFALTGHPGKQEIENKIKDFKSVGIDEVMAYPRSGCLVPYMSEEWFEVIRNTISACEENGVKLWLYDEFNWPSGGCGGKSRCNRCRARHRARTPHRAREQSCGGECPYWCRQPFRVYHRPHRHGIPICRRP